MSEALKSGIINELVAAEHPLLGTSYCNIYFNYSDYNYNMCNGSYCNYDSSCNSDCCDGDMCNYNSNCHPLAWLWWTLGSLFFLLCIISCIAGAKRRRRMAAYQAAVHRNNSHNNDTHVDVV